MKSGERKQEEKQWRQGGDNKVTDAVYGEDHGKKNVKS